MLRSRSRTEVHCSVFRSVMVISLILYRCYRHVIDVLNCQKLFCLSSHKGPSFKPTSSARSWWRFSALHPTCCSWTHWLWMCHSHIKKVESKYILGSHTEGDKDAWEELYIYIYIHIYIYIYKPHWFTRFYKCSWTNWSLMWQTWHFYHQKVQISQAPGPLESHPREGPFGPCLT